jgi:hypothetical protein
MQKLLFIWLLIIVSCKNKHHTALKDSPSENFSVDSLKVDLKTLLNEEKDYLIHTDSIATLIDIRNKFKKSKTAKSLQNNLETEILYDGFSEQEGSTINKVTATAVNSKQKLIYEYYYLEGSFIKGVTNIIDDKPFYSAIYFDGDKIYKPKELSLNTAQAMKAQSFLLINFFK